MKHVELVATMGTQVSVDVRTSAPVDRVGEAMDAVTARLQHIDEAFSPWRSGSWVSRLISGQVSPTDCPPEVRRVVELSMALMDSTRGYFSPYWRRLPYGEQGPDPTGLVKGLAAQQASDILLSMGMADHVVNAAGDIVVSGQSIPGDPSSSWHIGISDPTDSRAVIGVVELDQTASRWALATSGTAELGPHVSDPHTGASVTAVASATVVTRVDGRDQGAAVADACATALLAAGHAAPTLLDALASTGIEAVLVDCDGHVWDPRGLLGSSQNL